MGMALTVEMRARLRVFGLMLLQLRARLKVCVEDKFQAAADNSDDDLLVSPGNAGLSVMFSSLDFDLPLSAIKKTMEQESFEETHDFSCADFL